MRDRIMAIIDREVSRLDAMSRSEGLDNKATTRLDLLIKAYKSFVAEPTPVAHTTGAPTDPASLPTDDLLNDLQVRPGDVQRT